MINGSRRESRPGLTGGFAGGPRGSSDRADLWRRLLFTLGALFVYRVGMQLPVPGLDLLAAHEFFARSPGAVGLLDLLTGGAISHLSIFALGITPYISAFVIIQLASAVAPRLWRLGDEGPAGRRALNQYARILTVVLAAMQATGMAFGLESVSGLIDAPGLLFEIMTVLTLVTGAIFLMWLAEQITERGLGHGALLILACGVAGRLPFHLSTLFEMVSAGDLERYWPLATVALMAAIVALVVVVERAVRRVPVHDPEAAIGTTGDPAGHTHLALKLNPSGILAPLVAAVVATPVWGLVTTAGGQDPFLRHLVTTGMGYVMVDAALIVIVAVFFGLAILDPAQIATRLKDSGGRILGLPAGDDTARYLRRTQVILALIGAAYLVTASVLPELIFRRFYFPLPLPGFEFFLLAWLMVYMLEWVRPLLRR